MTLNLLRRQSRIALVLFATVGLYLLSVVFPASWPRGLIVQGAIFGAASGLLAVGLVLTYQTTRVINFAYGAMGSCAAQVGVIAYQRYDAPWLVAVLVAVLAGAIFGGLTDRIMRRFGEAPRLIVTVATIGLLQVFVGLQFAFAFWSGAFVLVPRFSNGLSEHTFTVGTTIFTANDAVALALVPVALVALSFFLLRTASGTAVRGMADNMDRSMLLGIPVRRLSRLVWILVGVLAAAVMILNAPQNGLPASPYVSTGGVFLPALAAAVVAKMEQLKVAMAAGVMLGIFNMVISNNVHKTAVGTVAMLIVVLAALVLRRWGSARTDSSETSWALSTSSRPLPPAVARLPEVRVARIVLFGAVAAVAVVFPLVAEPARVHTLSGHLITAIAVVSLVVLSGWSGTISLGQSAIVGVGAVVAGNLVAKQNLDLGFTLVAAALAGAVISVLIGLPALRIRPLFLAVTTLMFAAAMDQYFLNPANYPNWIPSDVRRPVLWKRFALSSENTTYFLCLGVLAVVVAIAVLLRRARPGRVLLATRDNTKAAEAMAVGTVRTRLAGMVVAGMIAGVAGALYVVLEGGVGSSSFPPQTSVFVFSIAVVGGLSSLSGGLAAVAVVQFVIFAISEASSQGAQFASLGTGTLVLGMLLVFPGGLGHAIENGRDRVAKVAAARRGIALEVGAAAGSLDITTTGTSTLVVPGPADEGTLLSCRNLTASYGPLQVLFGIDVDVRQGEVVCLLGTNGAGKSTVFKAITGLLASSDGEVTFDGQRIDGCRPDAIARRGLSMMPGGRGIFASLTVQENLRLACWQLPGNEVSSAQDMVLDMFPGLRARIDQHAGNLSGGEQQQLSLAMAFVTKPKLVLIDELSLGLAPTIVGMLCDRVAQIHAQGTTIVVVEQSINVAIELAERAVFLEKGTVRFTGPTAGLLERGDILRSVFIGKPVEHAPETTPQAERPNRGVGLRCVGLEKRFGGIIAVDGVDLTIEPGQIIGLVGHNGAGKTTLMDLISGFIPADEGSIHLGGQDVTGLAPNRRALAGLGRSFQEARLFPSLTVRDTLVVALDRHLANRGWVAAGFALPASVDAEFDAYERANEIINLLGLIGYADTPISDLSTGTRRIVELGCVLAMDPAIILLDEPSAGIAQKDTEALGPLLRKVQAETGSAIVIIEHDMGLMASLCDELVALELGSVICQGPPDEVLIHPRVIASYLGTNEAAIARSGKKPTKATPKQPKRRTPLKATIRT